MYLQNLEALWFFLLLPVVASLCWLAYWRRWQLRQYWGDEHLIARRSSSLASRPYILSCGALIAGIACVILALCRPTSDNGRAEFVRGTTDLIVMVDVSRSMAAVDYDGKIPRDSSFRNGTRLDMARYLIMKKIVPALGANRLGIVTYAGEAFPLAFLTQDVPAVDWVHRRAMTISSAPGNGSALVKAFLLSFQLFDLDSDPSHKKIIVLFSDGGNDDGLDALTAITQELKKRGIELVVIGLGKDTPSAIPISQLSPIDRQQSNGQEFYELKGEVVTTQLDDNVLRLLANRTGGRYVRVRKAADFSFDLFWQRLEMAYQVGKEELFVYPLLAGLCLLTLGWFLTWKFSAGTTSGATSLRARGSRKGGP